jgi:hypothetical protein
MYEARVLDEAGVERGLVLVGSDHGFNLGFTPGASDAHSDVVVARYRGDSFDRVLWEKLGRPPTYRYGFDFWRPVPTPTLTQIAITALEGPDSGQLRFEAESSWPPLRVERGWAHPAHLSAKCASRQRGLALHPSPGRTLSVDVEVHTLGAGLHDLETVWLGGPSGTAWVQVQLGLEKTTAPVLEPGRCRAVRLPGVALEEGPIRVSLRVKGDKAHLDYIQLQARDSSPTVNRGTGGNSVDN